MRRFGLSRTLLMASLLAAGCAATRDPGGSWPSLPSPWATVRQVKPGSAADAGIASQAAPPANRQLPEKAAPGEGDGSVAMAMLNGMNLERSGEWDKAREVYENIRKKDPQNAEAAHRLGIVADHQRRHAEAEQLFLFALERQPRNATLLADLGYCYYLQGQLAKAESALSKATKLEPTNERCWNNLGLVIGHQGRHGEALDCFRKSGSEADAHYNLAFVFASQDRVAQATQSFQAALVADPTHRRAREALASFEQYERLPEDLRDVNDLADNGVRYVPYIEGNSPSESAAAVANTSYNASRAAHALHAESRSMLSRNMASQRTEDMAKE